MTPDPGSLDNLRDIFEPAPVSWWPLAPLWWILAAIVAVTFVVLAIRAWQKWQVNSYRRAALRELQSASTASAIAEILKRTALGAFPRTQVASLSGSPWCDWLAETGQSDVPVTVARLLSSGIFRDTTESVQPLLDFATVWIKTHTRSLEN